MRRFITQYVRRAVADAYANPKGATLAELTKKVRKAADNTRHEGKGPTPPLTLDEWAELATYFAAQAHGALARQALNDDVVFNLNCLLGEADRVRANIADARRGRMQQLAEEAKAAPSAASIDALFGETDEVGTEPMTLNQEQP